MPVRSGLTLLTLLVATSASAADSVETIQKTAIEWARLRTETVRLETEWQWQRSILDASLTALNARIATRESERDVLAAKIAGEAASTASAVTRNDEARAALASLEQHLEGLSARLVATRPFLPPRLSAGLELPFRSIQDTRLGPAERMQHVVTIFNRCGVFNKSITYGEEELALEDAANPRLLEVLYWGLGYAYALDRAGNKAYFGAPRATGWTWEPRPEATAAVTQLIAIHNEKSDPVYVGVPVQVSDPIPATP
jgi:hypothetical protein